MTLRLIAIVVVGCLGLAPGSVEAQWRRCESDLEKLRDAADDAHDRSGDVASAQYYLQVNQEDLRRCHEEFGPNQVPAARPNDIPENRCRQTQISFESFALRYQSAIGLAARAFEELRVAGQTVEASCQFSFARGLVVESPDRSPACESFLARRPDAPLSALRVICPAEMSAEECTTCLGEPARR